MTLRLLTASLLSLSAVSAASAQVPSPRGAVPEARATALANSNALDTAVEYPDRAGRCPRHLGVEEP